MSFKKEHLYLYMLSIFHMGSVLSGMTITSRLILVNVPSIDHPIYITGGMFFIPVTFLIQDIVTEIYGYYNARKMLFSTIFVFILYVFFLYLIDKVPCNYDDLTCENFSIVARTLPRHALSFVVSLAIGGTINNYILAKLKLAFNRKFLAIRFISSTAIGEAFFQCVAVIISWYGTYTANDILPLAMISYFYKIIFAVCATPFNIYFCKYLRALHPKEFYNVF